MASSVSVPSGTNPSGARSRKGNKRNALTDALTINASVMTETDGISPTKKIKMQEEFTKIKIKKEMTDAADPQVKAKKSKAVVTYEPSQEVRPVEPENKQGDVVSKNSMNSKILVFEWTIDELNQLIVNLSGCLPKTDSTKYSTQIDKLDWEKVKFGNYSGLQCKEKWAQVMTRLRRFRTLTDMIVDAREWVKHPWSSFTNTKKQKHPDLPKKPLTPYFRYFLEKREKYSCEHPEMSMTDLAKILSKKFQQLNEKKKQKYKDSYEREIEVYKSTLEKFKREHPEEFQNNESGRHATPAHEGPDKPSTPFQLFQSDRLTRPEYMELDKKGATERIRKQWNALSDGKRIKWIRKAVQDEQRFAVEVAQYAEANPMFKVEPAKSVLSKAEKELKDRYDGKPERPPNSGYSLFSKIMLRELKEVPSKEKMAVISKRWKILSEADRLEYNKQAMKANQKYKEKYAIYLNSLVDEERAKVENEVKQSKRHTVEKYLIEKKNQTNGVAAVQVNGEVIAQATQVQAIQSKNKKQQFSAIFLYQQEKLPSFSHKHPNLSRTEITRLIAKEFGALSEKKKEKYKKLAEEASKRLDEDAATAVAATKSMLTADTGSRRKLFKGEPKKPPQSGYAVFSTEMLSILTGIDPKNRMSEIAKRWKCMSNLEKEKYKKKAQELLKKYNKDLHKFLSNLSEEELKEYYKLRAKGSKKLQPAKPKPVIVKAEPEQEIKKESDSDSSEEGDDDDDDDDSSDDDSDKSDNEAGSGSEESGSDSDDDDDSDEEEKKPEGPQESSSGDSDSDSESGSGSSEDSSDSGSDSD